LLIYRYVECPAAVFQEMEEAKRKAEIYYKDAGDSYKWVGVLRAADIFWNPEQKPALVLLESEPLGDQPRIIVRPRHG